MFCQPRHVDLTVLVSNKASNSFGLLSILLQELLPDYVNVEYLSPLKYFPQLIQEGVIPMLVPFK